MNRKEKRSKRPLQLFPDSSLFQFLSLFQPDPIPFYKRHFRTLSINPGRCSKHERHQGDREKARRLRQLQKRKENEA